MRNFNAMRNIMAVASRADGELNYESFRPSAGADDTVLESELCRLRRDGLLDADIEFGDGFGARSRCAVRGLTAEGSEFYRLIESDGVWGIIKATLDKAGVDVSYPLLKEVCEEIVKRYVISFIPID